MCRGLDCSVDLLLLRQVLCLILELHQAPHKVTRFHQDKTLTWQIGMKSFSLIFLKEQEEKSDLLCCLFNARLNHKDKKWFQTGKQRWELLPASLPQPLEVPHQSRVSLHLLYLPALLSFLYIIKSSTSLFWSRSFLGQRTLSPSAVYGGLSCCYGDTSASHTVYQ